MRVTCRLDGVTLTLSAPEVGVADERRGLSEAADGTRFAGWAASYRALLGRENKQAELLALGRALYKWLDAGTPWLERVVGVAQPPLVVEFQAMAPQDP